MYLLWFCRRQAAERAVLNLVVNRGVQGMPRHLVAYVHWSIIGRWKRLVLKYVGEGKPKFVHGSDDDRQFNWYAKNGAVLWIVDSCRSCPPTLIAKLKNVRRIDEDRECTVPAGLLSELKPLGKGKKISICSTRGTWQSILWSYQGIRQSRAVIAVASDHYGCRSSGREKKPDKAGMESKSRRNRIIQFTGEAEQIHHNDEGTISCSDLGSVSLLLSERPSDALSTFWDWFKWIRKFTL